MRLDHDLHMHTNLSACCRDKVNHTPENILSLADDMGLDTIGFSDHVWTNPALSPSPWYLPQDENQILELQKRLSKISTSVRVLVGCEADMIAPGKFGITREFAQGLDYVLLSCSHFHMTDFVQQPKDDTARAIAEHLLAFFASGVKSRLASAIAHPFLPIGRFDQLDNVIGSISDSELQDAFGSAAEHGVAIEITTHFLPSKKDRNFSIETPVRLLSVAKQAGCKFTLGTDAHCPYEQKRLPELAPLIKAIRVTEKDMLLIDGGGTQPTHSGDAPAGRS
jgi:HisJ family histidinol phosphate phosphatase